MGTRAHRWASNARRGCGRGWFARVSGSRHLTALPWSLNQLALTSSPSPLALKPLGPRNSRLVTSEETRVRNSQHVEMARGGDMSLYLCHHREQDACYRLVRRNNYWELLGRLLPGRLYYRCVVFRISLICILLIMIAAASGTLELLEDGRRHFRAFFFFSRKRAKIER